MRKCDQCDNEATVHEVTVRNGVKVEKHLCESCATTQGIAPPSTASTGEFLKQVVLSGAIPMQPTAPPAGKAHMCPTCRTTFAEFRQHGLLGCPDCYKIFEPQLGPLLERAHDGGVKHTGKVPRRLLGGPATPPPSKPDKTIVDLESRAERLRRIRRDLDKAVQAERYEEAAKLRDELKRIHDTDPPGPSSNPSL